MEHSIPLSFGRKTEKTAKRAIRQVKYRFYRMKFRVLSTLFFLTFANGTCANKDFIHQHPLLVAELGSREYSVYWFRHSSGQSHPGIIYTQGNRSDQCMERSETGSSTQTCVYSLSQTELKPSDTGIYYCAVATCGKIHLGNGTKLIIEESDSIRRTTVLQQPVPDRLHRGDSVTLQCSVISQICAGEYSVYWFRHSSGQSHPGIIYTQGNRSDQCMERSETGSSTQTCVYSLSQTELKPSDTGIYYCAVATCGKIHLGNGTKLIIEEYSAVWNPVVLTLFTISIISIIVNVFLVRLIQKNNKKEDYILIFLVKLNWQVLQNEVWNIVYSFSLHVCIWDL
ncbi:hypothetical protein QQF64_030811 [Cirrhinus molitorella]|uniref:Ig-like domain-containing protein n=1 Tax=Cirrhinus molitorella TaxID=172907 RepID=A0ABR3N4S7_9TELE